MGQYPEVMTLRLREGTKARIGAAASNEQEFIRGAIERALGRPEKPVDRVSVPKVSSTSGADADVLLAHLVKVGRVHRNKACSGLGWDGRRYERAEAGLVSSGRALEIDGMVEAL